MTSLSILYNTNLMLLAICALPLLVHPKQQGLDVEEESHEEEISILVKRKKNRRKLTRKVVIK